MREFREEDLMAHADGVLPEAERAALDAAIAADPALAARVERHRATRRVLASRFKAIAEEPVPMALQQLVQGHADDRVVPIRKRTFLPRQHAWLALAAMLLVVLGWGGGAWWKPARDPLSATLETAASGAPQAQPGGGEIVAMSTLQRRDGSYCREYERRAASAAPQRGLACRDRRGEWLEQSLPQLAEAAAAGGYQLADGEADIAGALGAQRLDAEQEARRIRLEWR